MAEIAVAILNYNGAEHLKKFLPSIIEHSPEAEIVVGDNKSTDNSVDLLESKFPSVKVVQLDNNYGYAGGYNRLIDKIESEYIILTNSDIEVTSGWIAPLMAVIKQDDQNAAVQPKILSYTNRQYFEYAGAGGGYLDKYGYPFCRGRIFSRLEKDTGQYDDEKQVFWASGACFLVKKSVFQTMEGFDESFFAHMEEIDLNWRMQHNGYKIMYTEQSKVYHLGGGTLAYNSARKTYLNFRNSWLTLLKNTKTYNRLKVFLIRYLLDLLSIVFLLVQFQVVNAFAVIRAHFYILTRSKIDRNHQLPAESIARNSSIITPENYSIVWQFFVRSKKKYSDL